MTLAEKLVRWLLAEEREDKKIRNRKLRELKQYSIDHGLGFYPEEVRRLPYFANQVNKYIEERARRDLPQEQFSGLISTRDLSTLVEVGGVLGCNGELHEIAYSAPTTENIRRLVLLPTGQKVSEKIWREMYGGRPRVRIIETSMGVWLNKDDIEKEDVIVEWHTHPVGQGELDKGDVDKINANLKDFGNKDVYVVLFQPQMDQSYWYQFKKCPRARIAME